ncbi:HAD family hydrolase [Dethiothermospora halolimnae]|uniref:HAD family hydrolase n=1 Tax=Dethiothermospora halolimnae TaxID=3114390 RepID=UPI003CCBDF50
MDTILFDLDGTLLPLDMEEFTKAYFKELSIKLSSYIEPEKLSKQVWSSTDYMIKNLDDKKTNMEAFFEDFDERIEHDVKELKPVFDEFYKLDFTKLKDVVYPNKIVKEIVNILKNKGYDMVIATNPLFPRDAIYHRIEWAGLDRNDFTLITTYENMHYCKPNLEYYKEILYKIKKDSKDIMMIGNDMQEDMVASKLGIKTYLVEDYMIDRGNISYSPNHKGSLQDLKILMEDLPSIK